MILATYGRSALTLRVEDTAPTALRKLDPFQTARDSETYLRGKLVGGHIPLPLADYLSILALYYEKSIQGTLQTIIQEWCYDREPLESIVMVLADRAYLEWQRRLGEYRINANTPARRAAYLEEVKDRLRRHKVTNSEHVEAVIAQLSNRMDMELPK